MQQQKNKDQNKFELSLLKDSLTNTNTNVMYCIANNFVQILATQTGFVELNEINWQK